MCPRRPKDPVSDAFLYDEEPVEEPAEEIEIITPPYYCHRGISFVHETGRTALCVSCFYTELLEKPSGWIRLRAHQLTIGPPIRIKCDLCDNSVCEYRDGDHCTPCTVKFVQYLRQHGIPDVDDRVLSIKVEETVETLL
ncbi:unnamed protein product [Lasius platythorax]|uniref:Uncharacterized protein n=1 Tax=Lasius platythorax TaxID=488582 RepID=A0AAV2NMN8_9HYME